MSKGSNSQNTASSSSTSPSAPAMAAYMGLMDRATNVSQTPYQAYTGQEVAGFNPWQQGAQGAVGAGVAGFAPYAGQAGFNISQSGMPVNFADIQQYQNPYTQDVVNATQADFDTQNKRAQSDVTGKAAAQNALGGNRVAVAQALTQEGQERVQAPVMAGLRSKGFDTSLQAAQQQKQQQLASGMGMNQADISAANAQFGMGSAEQATQQRQYTQQMTDYYTQQGYPFATAQWLASMILPTGSQMGSTSTGTSTTQGPTPNTWAQGAGAGLSFLSMFSDKRLKENVKEIGKLHDGQKVYRYNFKGDPTTRVGLISQEVEKTHPEAVKKVGGFGTVDYDAATEDAIKRWSGGAIHGFAPGGTPYGETGSPIVGSQGWVPTVGAPRGTPLQAAPFPQHAKLQDQKSSDYSQMGKSLGTIGKSLYDKLNTPDVSGVGETDAGSLDAWNAGFDVPAFDRGGGIPVSSGFSGGSYANGGVADLPEIDMSDEPPIRYAPSTPDERISDHNALRLSAGEPNRDAGSNMAAVNEGILPRPSADVATAGAEPSIVDKATEVFGKIAPGLGMKSKEAGLPSGVMSYDNTAGGDGTTDISARRRTAPAFVPGVGVAPQEKTGMGGFNPLGLSDEARQGLISMGLSMMANRRGGPGSFLASVGEGGEQGMGTYASAKAATAQRALEQQKLEQARLLHNTITPYQRAQLDRENLTPIGTNDDGYPVFLDRRTGKETIGTTKLQSKAPIGYVRNPDGSMSAVKGGPADPEIVTGLAKAKQGGPIPDATADFLAERVLAGDSKALVGMGRGAQGAENIIRIQGLVAQKAAERNLNAKDILSNIADQAGLTASQRTFGTQIARMAVNSTEAEGAIQQGLEVSKKVPRGKWVPLNQLLQMAEGSISDPDLLEFRAANLAIINTYARAINPIGVPTVDDKKEAHKIVTEATSQEAYERVMHRMLKEIAIAHAAPAVAKKELEKIRKSSSAPSETPKAETAVEKPKTVTQNGYTYTLQPDGSYK